MKGNGRKHNGKYYFDKEAAKRVVSFFETFLVHIKGEMAGQPFKPLQWQRKKVLEPLFGWKRADGTRKFRTAYIEVPSKNGKSTLAAGIALFLTFSDFEMGAEVYSAAAERDQAGIIFNIAKEMVEASRALKKRAEVFKRSIVVSRWASSYKVLSADAYTKHGINAHGIIFDELHAQPHRDLYDTLRTMTGARRQPLMISFTTAGFDEKTICGEIHKYAEGVLKGTIQDETFFAFIAKADEKEEWTDPKVWKRANPSLGKTISVDFLQAECDTAKQSPAYENTFRRLHLNQWTKQSVRWLAMKAWDKCAFPVDSELLAGRDCYGGLDLATTTDIASLVLVFPPDDEEPCGSCEHAHRYRDKPCGEGDCKCMEKVAIQEPYYVLPFFWIPEEAMRERSRKDKVLYDVWVKQGLITATEGNLIDYRFIMGKIGEVKRLYNLRALAFDRWGSQKIVTDLVEDLDFTVDLKEAKDFNKSLLVQFGQGYVSMSPPAKEFLNLILGKRIAHGGHHVLRWMAENVAVKQDPAGNIKPDKAKSTEKIDGIVATIMSLGVALPKINPGWKKSIYESRGVEYI